MNNYMLITLYAAASAALLPVAASAAGGCGYPSAAAFDSLLQLNVRSGDVYYPGFEDESFAAWLSAAEGAGDERCSEDHRTAYLLNVWNARLIQFLRDAPGISSPDRVDTLFGRVWTFCGRQVSLASLRDSVLRATSDHLLLFAFSDGSEGGPHLLKRAYTAQKLQSQLVERARHTLRRGDGVRVDAASMSLSLPEWLAPWIHLFGADTRTRALVIARYMRESEAAAIAAHADRLRIVFHPVSNKINARIAPPTNGTVRELPSEKGTKATTSKKKRR
jgi:hypothetical protein